MYKLDKKDRKILFELDKNCRQSINEIAKKTRLNRDIIQYRIKQLEKSGYIAGYVAVLDFTKFGYTVIRLYLKLQNTNAKIEEEIIKYIMEKDTVIIAYRTDGQYELAIGLLVKSLKEYQETYKDILEKYRKYIVDKNFSLFEDFVHYFRNYLVDEQRDYSEISTGSFKKYSYDEIDIKILSHISLDARMPALEISKLTKIPSATVIYRLRNLEKNNVIVAYRANIDYHKLGMEYYKVDLILEDLSIIPGLHEYILRHPNVIYRDKIIGGSDFEFDLEIESQEKFYEVIEDMRSKFPGKIRSYFYYKAIKIYKYSFFPKLLLKEIEINKKN